MTATLEEARTVARLLRREPEAVDRRLDVHRRLERRLERERRARADAERIAEDGLRALYDANRSLDRRIAERTRELEDATRRAEAASNARGAFLAHISPIEWDNVILYGQYVIDPRLIR